MRQSDDHLAGNPQVKAHDPATEKEMMELFVREARSGKTVICITHFPDNVSLCDKVIVLARGQLIFYGTPTELLAHFQINAISELYPQLSVNLCAFQPATVRAKETWLKSNSKAPAAPLAKVPGALAQTTILAARYVRLLVLDEVEFPLVIRAAGRVGDPPADPSDLLRGGGIGGKARLLERLLVGAEPHLALLALREKDDLVPARDGHGRAGRSREDGRDERYTANSDCCHGYRGPRARREPWVA